jgi:hypothetical protein
MKKFLAIAMLLMYGFSSTGMTVSLHYCCGKLKSIDWTVPKHKSCDHKQSMGNKPCCETKLISKKDKTDTEVSGFLFKTASADLVGPVSFVETTTLKPVDRLLVPEIFAPPPLSPVALYISYRVFRI